MTLIPMAVSSGRMPISLPRALRLMPKARGMEGPVISASSTPTFSPRRERRTASIAVTEDLPTPPLPLLTATTFLMLLNSPSLA